MVRTGSGVLRALALSALVGLGCGTACPRETVRVGSSCLDPSAVDGGTGDGGTTDGAPSDASGFDTDAETNDSAVDVCDQCLASELCFEGECVAFDACSRSFGVPCAALGPVYMKASHVNPADEFGWAVAVSGDGLRVAVSAHREDSASASDPSDNMSSQAGAVFVFRRMEAGWTQEAYIKAMPPGEGDTFGIDLDLDGDGDVLVVGAYRESGAVGAGPTDNTAPGAGAAYVFHREGTTWTQNGYLKASNGESDDELGLVVAVNAAGTRVAASALREGDSGEATGAEAGAVYVFDRVDQSWVEDVRLKASNGNAGDGFGGSLGFTADGSLLAIGASREDGVGNGTSDAGAVYVFADGGGGWSEEDVLRASNASAGDRFGFSLSLGEQGTRLVASSLFGDTAQADSGAVYVFERSLGTWSEVTTLTSPSLEADDEFGHAVAISGDGHRVAVGTRKEDSLLSGVVEGPPNETASDSGAVYLFDLDGSEWSETGLIKASNPNAGDWFGHSVDLSRTGGTVACGAPLEDSDGMGPGRNPDDNSLVAAGAAYVYRVAP